MARARVDPFSGAVELLLRVLAHGLEHRVSARSVRKFLDDDQRAIDKARGAYKNDVLVGGIADHRRGRGKRPTFIENREQTKQSLLFGGKVLIAPPNDRQQRLLAGQCRPTFRW